MSRRDRWIVGGFLGLIGLIGLMFLAAVFREGASESNEEFGGRGGRNGDPYRNALHQQKGYVRELIAALRAASVANDHPRAVELTEMLARQGEAAVDPVVESFAKDRTWSHRVALLDVLASIRSRRSVAALEKSYGSLLPSELPLRKEIVRRLGRMGGRTVRKILAKLLAGETHDALRLEISNALVALGMTPDEVLALEARDQKLLKRGVSRMEKLRSKLKRIHDANPETKNGMAVLTHSAESEVIVAVAVEAFRKLEDRNDAEAATILARRVRAQAQTREERMIQTNALASLTRMTTAEARVQVRAIALGEDDRLRVQTIEMVGGFGDEAMLPLLDQVSKVDSSAVVRAVVDKARQAIELRAAAQAAHP